MQRPRQTWARLQSRSRILHGMTFTYRQNSTVFEPHHICMAMSTYFCRRPRRDTTSCTSCDHGRGRGMQRVNMYVRMRWRIPVREAVLTHITGGHHRPRPPCSAPPPACECRRCHQPAAGRLQTFLPAHPLRVRTGEHGEHVSAVRTRRPANSANAAQQLQSHVHVLVALWPPLAPLADAERAWVAIRELLASRRVYSGVGTDPRAACNSYTRAQYGQPLAGGDGRDTRTHDLTLRFLHGRSRVCHPLHRFHRVRYAGAGESRVQGFDFRRLALEPRQPSLKQGHRLQQRAALVSGLCHSSKPASAGTTRHRVRRRDGPVQSSHGAPRRGLRHLAPPPLCTPWLVSVTGLTQCSPVLPRVSTAVTRVPGEGRAIAATASDGRGRHHERTWTSSGTRKMFLNEYISNRSKCLSNFFRNNATSLSQHCVSRRAGSTRQRSGQLTQARAHTHIQAPRTCVSLADRDAASAANFDAPGRPAATALAGGRACAAPARLVRQR